MCQLVRKSRSRLTACLHFLSNLTSAPTFSAFLLYPSINLALHGQQAGGPKMAFLLNDSLHLLRDRPALLRSNLCDCVSEWGERAGMGYML